MTKGWKGDSLRHSLAARGIKTSTKLKSRARFKEGTTEIDGQFGGEAAKFKNEQLDKFVVEINKQNKEHRSTSQRREEKIRVIELESAIRQQSILVGSTNTASKVMLRLKDTIRLLQEMNRGGATVDKDGKFNEAFTNGAELSSLDFLEESQITLDDIENVRKSAEARLESNRIDLANVPSSDSDEQERVKQRIYGLLGILSFMYVYTLFTTEDSRIGNNSSKAGIKDKVEVAKKIVSDEMPKLFTADSLKEFKNEIIQNAFEPSSETRAGVARQEILLKVASLPKLDPNDPNEANRITEANKITQNIDDDRGALRANIDGEGRRTKPDPSFRDDLATGDVWEKARNVNFESDNDIRLAGIWQHGRKNPADLEDAWRDYEKTFSTKEPDKTIAFKQGVITRGFAKIFKYLQSNKSEMAKNKKDIARLAINDPKTLFTLAQDPTTNSISSTDVLNAVKKLEASEPKKPSGVDPYNEPIEDSTPLRENAPNLRQAKPKMSAEELRKRKLDDEVENRPHRPTLRRNPRILRDSKGRTEKEKLREMEERGIRGIRRQR